jgi:uncharacterized damage-inducible protein DinB
MDLAAHFRNMARYNRIANERLYEWCAALDDAEYRKERRGSFGSIHALLNHLLLADRIWMARFEGGGETTPPLNTTLYDVFADLRTARSEDDARIERFFETVSDTFFGGSFRYVNNQGKLYEEAASVAVAHFFNHQAHHRGQVHVMLSQTPAGPPALDLHRILNP